MVFAPAQRNLLTYEQEIQLKIFSLHRKEWKKGFENLAKFIHTEGIRFVVLEGDSAIPTWRGVVVAWKRLFNDPVPARIRIPSKVVRSQEMGKNLVSQWNPRVLQSFKNAPTLVLSDTVETGKGLGRAIAILEQKGFRQIRTAAFSDRGRCSKKIPPLRGALAPFIGEPTVPIGPFWSVHRKFADDIAKIRHIPTISTVPIQQKIGTMKRFYRLVEKAAGKRRKMTTLRK